MKESHFNVDVLDIPVQNGSNVKKGAEGLKAGRRSSSFVVVNEVALSKPLCDVPNLVACNVASIVTFAFAYEFALERTLSFREL